MRQCVPAGGGWTAILIAILIQSEDCVHAYASTSVYTSVTVVVQVCGLCGWAAQKGGPYVELTSRSMPQIGECMRACLRALINATLPPSPSLSLVLAATDLHVHACVHACIHTYLDTYTHTHTDSPWSQRLSPIRTDIASPGMHQDFGGPRDVSRLMAPFAGAAEHSQRYGQGLVVCV